MKSLLVGIGRYLYKVYNNHDSRAYGYKLRSDSRVPTTTPVQPPPAWFPLSMVPRSPAAWRTPIARGHRCRASPPHHSGQACEDKPPARAVPSTFPSHRWSRLLPPCPLPASLSSMASACTRRNPALRAHVSRPDRSPPPSTICYCTGYRAPAVGCPIVAAAHCVHAPIAVLPCSHCRCAAQCRSTP
jgi:hypothetical protein